MARSLLRKLVRNFPENGPKLLLENGANVRDMLLLLGDPRAEAIDFSAMTVERTHFVHPDYAHVALDLLFKVPFRVDGAAKPRSIFIYLLIEHQSAPERFFMLRLAEHLLDAYKMQKRAWDKKHATGEKFLLQPVMPIVLYTGERNWENIEALPDLVEAGLLFKDMIPTFKPHLLNLRDTPREKLVNEGGFFGQVLLLIRERHSQPAEFQRTLEEVVTRLEQMPTRDRNRWVEFLSYILALVYHARGDQEQPKLREVVDSSIQADPHRQEYTKMGRTIAEMYMDQGEQRGNLKYARKTLLLQLRKRFKKVPRKVEARISATTEIRELETWLVNIIDAKTFAEVGIPLDEEQPKLREVVDNSIQADPHRQEYTKMGRTIAEMYMDQGEQRGELKRARSILLLLLRKRFKKLPRKVEARIAVTTEIRDLETWQDNLLEAKTLAEVGIPLD